MKPKKTAKTSATNAPSQLRIIGGTFRGSKLTYHGDPLTRPMKDRVREALFNLLGNDVGGKYAIDLFAGTGALALEAISRGAVGAICIERHFPTAKLIAENAAAIDIQTCRVSPGSAFVWSRNPDAPRDVPWLVFCSPPYEFYVSREVEMLTLLESLLAAAPRGSIFCVESDDQFEQQLLPHAQQWDIRTYPPAVVSILRTAL